MALPAIPEYVNAATAFIDRHLHEGRGEQVALRWADHEVTYAQLAAQVNRAGNVLRSLGVRAEERVLLVLYDTPEFVYSFWGAIKIGAVPVPVNTFMSVDEYVYTLNDSRAGVIIAANEVWPILAPAATHTRWLRHRLIVGPSPSESQSFTALMQHASPGLDPELTHSEDSALWLYSSGSTGMPKGVVHTHRNLLCCVETYGREVLAIGPEDVTLAAPRLFFAYGLGGGMYFALHAGATAVLVSERPTPHSMFVALQRYRPTLFFGVPTLYAAMLQVKDAEQTYDLSCLRLCLSAGEPLPAELFTRWRDRFGVEILDGLGSTELLHIFLSNRVGQVHPGSSGTPVPGYELRITNDNGQEVQDGEIGNLLVKGGSVTTGYWHKLEATRRALQGEWIRTGDTYYRDAEGVYWYCGRSDDMLKVSGQWVSPAEVEGVLFAHPAVLEAAVVGWEDDNRLLKPKAFVVLKDGYAPSLELAGDLQTFIKARMLPHKYPRWIEFVSDLPKTATGKIQRYKLRVSSQ